MDFDAISSFLDISSGKGENVWQLHSLKAVANHLIPEVVTGKQSSLLRADMTTLWTQWFLESICDPEKFVDRYPCYAHIVHAVDTEAPFIFSTIDINKRAELVIKISRLINNEVRRRQHRKRTPFDLRIKEYLWDVYSSEHRCWMCGYQFSKWAVDKFLERSISAELRIPQFIDYLKPHGLSKRDFQIEIDHVFPFAEGGNEDIENLRLACGWCNTHKASRLSIYDVAAQPLIASHPQQGKVSLPHPFWVIRLLALRRQCEHGSGCDKTLENSSLTITPRHPEGSMNPTNLQVTCTQHDPIGSARLVSRTIAEQMWKK
jgi:5-methylcytosine-specific restriction endonuclease McrA